jgi:hypothetical protein
MPVDLSRLLGFQPGRSTYQARLFDWPVESAADTWQIELTTVKNYQRVVQAWYLVSRAVPGHLLVARPWSITAAT